MPNGFRVTDQITDIVGLSAALSAKALLSHTHAISDVTNLQTSLNALAPKNTPTFVGAMVGQWLTLTAPPSNVGLIVKSTDIEDVQRWQQNNTVVGKMTYTGEMIANVFTGANGAFNTDAEGRVGALSFTGDGSALTNLPAPIISGEASNLTAINESGQLVDSGYAPADFTIALVLNAGTDADGRDITNLGTVTATTFNGELQPNYLTGFPSDSSLYLDGNGSWSTPSVNVGGTESNLTRIGEGGVIEDAGVAIAGLTLGYILSIGSDGGTADITNVNNVAANYLSGDGSYVTNINPGNIAGYPADGGTYLDGNGSWSTPSLTLPDIVPINDHLSFQTVASEPGNPALYFDGSTFKASIPFTGNWELFKGADGGIAPNTWTGDTPATWLSIKVNGTDYVIPAFYPAP